VTAAAIVSVERVTDDTTTCRRCEHPIQRGQRAALVLGAGRIHIRCLLARQADDADQERVDGR
jgi:hypothetical protein